jgi:hypothetical protein
VTHGHNRKYIPGSLLECRTTGICRSSVDLSGGPSLLLYFPDGTVISMRRVALTQWHDHTIDVNIILEE